ncbi:MAG: UDP-N-acetylmuramoyl-L-alanine--D-glutamate ligase [Myxococcota bacterium]
MSYAGRQVLVLGLGRSGHAAVALLLQRAARVSAYDRDPAAFEGLPAEVVRIEGDELPALDPYDTAIVSPGLAVAAGPNVVPEIDLAAEFLEAPLVGVTGTNGKSTTCVMIAEMLRASGLEATAGGNLGTPLCALVDRPARWLVAELSSFQLEHARRLRARVAVLLNLAPDHLDRHGTLAAYGDAKARLAELQQPEDTLVANLDDAWATHVAAAAPAALFGFSEQRELTSGAHLSGSDLVVARDGRVIVRVDRASLSPAARTPVANALAAAAAALACGATAEGIGAVLASFSGLPHRSTEVCVRGGVRYVDDSKATNPAAAAASLAGQAEPTVWLCGGRNKGLDFVPLAPLAERARAVIAYGESARALGSALEGAAEVVLRCKLEDAVAEAAARARPGDVVLLAPACASHDQFRSFEERGERFAELARALPGDPGEDAC